MFVDSVKPLEITLKHGSVVKEHVQAKWKDTSLETLRNCGAN